MDKAPVDTKSKICNVCDTGVIQLVKAKVSFSTKQDKWPYIFTCPHCNAAVGCHPNTLRPLGPLAPAHIRALRAKAHFALDPLWESGLMSRDNAYKWLAKELGLDVDSCHIVQLDRRQLTQAILLARQYFKERENSIPKRRKKLRDRIEKKNDTHRQHVIRRKKLR